MIGVFGAAGFIGRHVVRQLTNSGLPVRAVSRRFDSSMLMEFENRVEFLQADLRDPLEMSAAIAGLTIVVQLINTSSPGIGNRNPVSDITDNVIPHVQFLVECSAAQVRRVVYVSSGGTVYGPSAQIPTPESAPNNPICSYGVTKLVVEKYLGMLGHTAGLSYVVLRVANAYGPGQRYKKGQGLIPAVLGRARAGLPVTVIGDGSARRDFVYATDIAAAVEAAVTVPGDPQEIINIGSGESRAVRKVIDQIQALMGVPIEREYVPARPTDVEVAELSIDRARLVLGWKPCVSFDDGLRMTVESFGVC